jgi:hypothetical protein
MFGLPNAFSLCLCIKTHEKPKHGFEKHASNPPDIKKCLGFCFVLLHRHSKRTDLSSSKMFGLLCQCLGFSCVLMHRHSESDDLNVWASA